jgi:hypothetical protein
MLINLMCLITLLSFFMCLSFYLWYMGVMVHMDCTLNNFVHFLLNPEQPPVNADQFDVPYDPLELLNVPIMTEITENKLETNQQEQQEQEVKKIAVASSLWRLWGRLDCWCRPLPGPQSDSVVKTDESKGVPASCGLGPLRTWNTAFKSSCKFVTPEIFQRINASKNRPWTCIFPQCTKFWLSDAT